MNKNKEDNVEPSPYFNSHSKNKTLKSQKVNSDKNIGALNLNSRSKSVTGDKINSSKNSQQENFKDKNSSKKSNSKHAFDYAPQIQNKSRSSIKTNSKKNALSKNSDQKRSQRMNQSNHNLLHPIEQLNKFNLREHKTESEYNSENDDSINGVVKTPEDGKLLGRKIIANGSPQSKNSEYDNRSYASQSSQPVNKSHRSEPDGNHIDENYLTHITHKSDSIRSLEMMNKRPSQRSNLSIKSNKSLIKNIYYPMSVERQSKRSEPMKPSNNRISSENRNMSLPDIRLNKNKRATASFNHSKASKNSGVSKHHKTGKNKDLHELKEIGQSYMSFNSLNPKGHNTHDDVNRFNKLDMSRPSLLRTDQDIQKLNETFESCTTEGKKPSLAMPSTSKIAEEAYGGSSYHSKQSDGNKSRSSKSEGPHSKKSQSLRSKLRSETIGEDSLPEIANSVVEDSLPFKGLENHHKTISKEGFLDTNKNFMQNTNQNFYSSFKSKQTENFNNVNYKENGFPILSSKDHFANHTEVYDDRSDLERFQNSNVNPKSMTSSPIHKRSNITQVPPLPQTDIPQENNTTQEPTFRTNNINGSKARSKNKSKRQQKNQKKQPLTTETTKRRDFDNEQYRAEGTNMTILQAQGANDTVPNLGKKDSHIINVGEQLRKGLINVDNTYEHIRSISKQKDEYGTKKTVKRNNENNKKWNDVMSFLEKNPNVLMEMLPNDVDAMNMDSATNRQGVINFRSVTGISAPGRSKYSNKYARGLQNMPQFKNPKPESVVAPWKMQQNSNKLNKDIKTAANKRANHNNSSKRKTDIKSKNTTLPSQNTSTKQVKEKIKLHNVNRSGLNTQPISRPNRQLQSKAASRNDSNKQNQINGVRTGFKMYQTPSFLSPHSITETERIPSIASSMTTFSNTNTQKNQNGTSMLDRHTIIFESDTENNEDQETPKNTQKRNTKSKTRSNFESEHNGNKSIGTQQKDMMILQETYHNMFNIETGDNLENTYDSRALAKSDIPNDQNIFDTEYDDYHNIPKTAYGQDRIGVRHFVTQNTPAKTVTDMDYNFKGDQPLTEISHYPRSENDEAIEFQSSHGSQVASEIYLNKNSAEENPENLDDAMKETKTISR